MLVTSMRIFTKLKIVYLHNFNRKYNQIYRSMMLAISNTESFLLYSYHIPRLTNKRHILFNILLGTLYTLDYFITTFITSMVSM